MHAKQSQSHQKIPPVALSFLSRSVFAICHVLEPCIHIVLRKMSQPNRGQMKKIIVLLCSLALLCSIATAVADDGDSQGRNANSRNHIQRVLLISVDGMHAVD